MSCGSNRGAIGCSPQMWQTELMQKVEFRTAKVRPTPASINPPIPPLPSVAEEADDEEGGQAHDDDGRIIAVLPHGHRILHHAGAESFIVAGHGIEEPAAMAVPESPLGIVRISGIVTMGMMTQMIGRPFRAGVLAAHPPATSRQAFTQSGHSKLRCVNRRWYPHGNSQAGDQVEDGEHRPIQPGIAIQIPYRARKSPSRRQSTRREGRSRTYDARGGRCAGTGVGETCCMSLQ